MDLCYVYGTRIVVADTGLNLEQVAEFCSTSDINMKIKLVFLVKTEKKKHQMRKYTHVVRHLLCFLTWKALKRTAYTWNHTIHRAIFQSQNLQPLQWWGEEITICCWIFNPTAYTQPDWGHCLWKANTIPLLTFGSQQCYVNCCNVRTKCHSKW